MAKKLFEEGNPGGPGGAREGAGRPKDWLKSKCQEIIDQKAVLQFLGSVVAGKDFEQVVNSEGETLKLPPPLKDRLKAAELLLDRGYGKPGQAIEVAGPNGDPLPGIPGHVASELVEALRQRIIKPSGKKA